MHLSLFTYGAFAPGQVHFPKFAQFIASQKPAFVKAEVYKLRCGYPVVLPSSDSELVEGTLLDLEVTDSFVSILDQLLGYNPQQPDKSLLQRCQVQAHVDNFSQVDCQIYSINPKKLTASHRKITGGDWKRDLRENPPITESLQDRQKQYIHKLSQSKGRDIVPIKLDLYRELMNLELIVDKGRRLALTPMGKEAALFTH